MGELVFVGMGLYDERDLGLRALEEIGKARAVFAEQYTSRLREGSLTRLSEETHVPIRELTREELEGERVVLEALERGGTVVLLVAGEALAATTHLSLRLDVERKGHTTRILHGPSILTAAASLAGLSHYKFGRAVSLPYPSDGEGYRPVSPYEAIAANRRSGLHTLILLDLDPSRGRYLTADGALRHLSTLEDELRGGVAGPFQEFCVVARAGSPDAEVWVGERRTLQVTDFGPPLHSILVPGPSLHFLEEEALAVWRERTHKRSRGS